MIRKKRCRGLRLDDYVVGRLPIKRIQYTGWDLVVQGCGIRISGETKSCVISVRLGARKKFETVGRVSPDQPYEYLREIAIKRIVALEHARLPQALAEYVTTHPALSERTIKDYRKSLERGFGPQMDQPASLLVSEEILRLNQAHLQVLTEKDPLGKPPAGFWTWQGTLTVLRAVLGWYAAQKNRPNPWPERRAPVSEVAARIGISDVGLAKACRRAEIPIPARGFWAKIGAGQPLCWEPLPPEPAGIPNLIRITGTKSPVIAA